MSDEQPAGLPPLPSTYELPQDIIDRWNGITHAGFLAVPVTKHQLDNLMTSMRQSLIAQMALGEALRLLSRNEIESADREFRKHQEVARYAYSNTNFFIAHVMATAQPIEPNNG